jgi:GDP-L-fucose synthase
MTSFHLDKDTRFYIAGHRGLIGSAFLHRLERDGYSNLITRTHDELELCDAGEVERFFAAEQPEVVIMAAGKVGGIVANQEYPADFLTSNLSMQLNTMQSAWKHGVRRFLFFASSCMYPRETSQPMSEDQLLTGVPESTSIAYATAKMAGLQLCLAYNRQFGSNVFMPLIPNSVYGVNDNFDLQGGHVLSSLIRRFHEAKERGDDSITLWGSGKPKREFIHANDLVDAVLHLLNLEQGVVEFPVNIGSGIDYSIAELAKTIAKVVDFGGAVKWDTGKPDGAPRKLLDSKRLTNTGWRPCVSLEDGIRETYRWYVGQHEGATAEG